MKNAIIYKYLGIGFTLIGSGFIAYYVKATTGKVCIKDLNPIVGMAEKIAVTVVNETPALTSNN